MIGEKTGAGRAQWIRATPPSPGPGLDTRQRTEQTGLCRGQTAYSGNGEPGYPKWPGAVAILVPFMIGEKSHDIPLRPKKHPTTSYYILV